MTNREKFKDELLNLLGHNIAINRQTGTPVRCESLCSNCLFNGKCINYTQKKAFREWLDSEYIEPIKTIKASELPIDTKVICWDYKGSEKYKGHFAELKNGVLYAFAKGKSSWTVFTIESAIRWEHMELEDGTVVLAE